MSTCILHRFHSPKPLVIDSHHVVPRSWKGGPGKAGETIEVCGNCHSNIHANIDALVLGKKPPSRKNSGELRWAKEAMSRAAKVGAIPEKTL